MAEPKKLTQKEYDAIRSDYEKRYGYDSRSDEEKDAFDKKFDEHYQVEKKDASGDATEGTEKGDRTGTGTIRILSSPLAPVQSAVPPF